MKTYGDVSCKQLKVLICCVYRHLVANTYSTHQKISIGSLNSFGTAEVEVSGGQNIILGKNREVRKTG